MICIAFKIIRFQVESISNWKRGILCILFLGFICITQVSFADSNNDDRTETNLLLPPPGDAEGKIDVGIAFRVLNLSNINEVDQCFSVVGYMIALWQDPRLAYVQKSNEDEYRTYKKDEIWVPQFDFSNGVAPHLSYDSTIRVYPDGSVCYLDRSSASLSTNLNLYKYPFDTQKLMIQIQPFAAEETKVFFSVASLEHLSKIQAQKPMSAQDEAYSSLAQWSVIDTSASVEKVQGLGSEETTMVNFEIEIQRLTSFYLLKVFFPLLMIVILSWTAFWMDPKELSSIVQITITTLLTVIAFSFAISANLPKVPYLTFIDSVFLASYIFVFSTTLAITLIHVFKTLELEEHRRMLQERCQIIYPVLFTLVILILMFYFHMFSR